MNTGNSLKIPLAFSIAIHSILFIFLSVKMHHANYILIPVELQYFQPLPAPASPATEKSIQPATETKEKEKVAVSKQNKQEEIKPAVESKPSDRSGFSSQLNVDSVKFPYAYYTNQIRKKIESNWQWSNSFGNMRSLVFFRIARDGSIKDASVKESSGDPTFDSQSLRAVGIAGPFAPLPDGYNEDDLKVNFEFVSKE